MSYFIHNHAQNSDSSIRSYFCPSCTFPCIPAQQTQIMPMHFSLCGHRHLTRAHVSRSTPSLAPASRSPRHLILPSASSSDVHHFSQKTYVFFGCRRRGAARLKPQGVLLIKVRETHRRVQRRTLTFSLLKSSRLGAGPGARDS